MAYDVELSDRLRAGLSTEPDVTEKRMFGGLAFMVAGHLAVAAGHHGGLLLRVDPTRQEAVLADPRVSSTVMGRRSMRGWLHVDVDDSVSEADLLAWLRQAVVFVRSLPPH